MDRALYIAMSGAKQNVLGQTAHSNNLANASTTGFRQDLSEARSQPVFGDYYPTRAFAMEERPATDFTPGTLVTTGNDLDLALKNQGFFAVVGPDGKEAYTRRGDFMVDANGRMLNGDGLQAIGNGGPMVAPINEHLLVADDGTVSIQGAGDTAAAVAEIDRFKLVLPDVKTLEKGADGLFRVRNAPPNYVAPPDASVQVTSGHLEHSNVSPVLALTEIMSLHRQYEMQVKMMKTVDENTQATTQILMAQ
ncbi:MAG: flagellar basal body rod protein FlgF [Oceanospirillaceae bacterium]|nr:flagellar basal body rod protein FlgF [Oceanospirillaceae bacterium]MCP5350131.1 flagellar basal body rod protein FlgF [Oceanospirillaceae bacterium]